MRDVAALAMRLRAVRAAALASPVCGVGVAIGALAVALAALVARGGTDARRWLGLATLVALVAVYALARWLAARRWRDVRASVVRTVSAVDAPLGAAIARAVGLAGRAVVDEHAQAGAGDAQGAAVTRALAELHLARRLAEVRPEPIAARADDDAKRLGVLGVGLAGALVAIVAIDPHRVIEGIDVAIAREGVAPLPLAYLDDLDLTVRPPEYLGLPPDGLRSFSSTSQPVGTEIVVRGRPEIAGRALVLTDGTREVPFTAEGEGRVVARWTVARSGQLSIAARFGEVLVPQPESMRLEAIVDEAPEVVLEGAPRTVKLVEAPSITLPYEARDDHGLREIALVLRAGAREERRVLSRPKAGTAFEQGGHELSTRDPFFQKSVVPVSVTIEARDNDGVGGPKWGASAAIVVVPPRVGEAEALRLAALYEARDVVVDLLAARLVDARDRSMEPADFATRDAPREVAAIAKLEQLLGSAPGGLPVRGRVRRVAAGQLRRLREAGAALAKKPGAETERAVVDTTEAVALAIDSAVRAFANDEAVRVSKKLAEVAKEAAAAAREAGDPAAAAPAAVRIDAAVGVLEGGGQELTKLGELGADLGDFTRGALARVARARRAHAFRDAELAAIDLAERLADPMSSVAGGGRPGVESGGGGGGGSGSPDEGEASEAGEASERSGAELDDLLKRHKDELDRVEQALDGAATQEERDALRELAKRSAEAIREAARDLPQDGAPGTSAERLGEARRRAESTAGELERGEIGPALREGREAVEALRDAAKRAAEEGDSRGESAARRAANRAEEALDALEEARKKNDRAAEERAKDALREAAKNEGRMAERARDLEKGGRDGDGALPEDTLEKLRAAEEAMREAERLLDEGKGEEGREKQREAQRLLELARGDDDDEGRDDAPSDAEGSDGKRMAQETDVPKKDAHKKPEDFRKRVLEGLARPGDARLKEALRRYAEGLLQ